MNPETYRKRLSTKSRKWLMEKARELCNEYIRNRDAGKPCVSCGRFVELEAGHFYSAGKYKSLKFDENNIHGQCKQCNYHLHGNLTEYRKGLERRIGIEALNHLGMKAGMERQAGSHKVDRFTLIEIIMKYHTKVIGRAKS